MDKAKLAGRLAMILVFILSAIYLFVPWAGGYNWVAWLLVILDFIAGPSILIAYIIEVRKGVFADIDEDE